MKIITLTILTFLLAACGQQYPAPQAQKNQAIFVLIENGGTVTENEQDDAKTALCIYSSNSPSLNAEKPPGALRYI